MVSLGNSFEVLAIAVGFAVQSEAELTNKFLGNVGRFEVGEVFIVGLATVGFLCSACGCSAKTRVFLENS